MVHVIKVYLEDPGSGKQEIRRIAVSSDTVCKIELLCEKIIDLFPSLKDKTFDLGWKDHEGDLIVMSSDMELAQALANGEDGLIKIYISLQCEKQRTAGEPCSNGEVHPRVVCDSCNKNVSGVRYKCLQCKDYDLCSSCNTADKHPHHDMIKLVKPADIPREWIFDGARKMYRSLFGCRSGRFHHQWERKKEADSSSKAEAQNSPKDNAKAPWFDTVTHLLNGEYVEAEKLFQEKLCTFLNLADIEVKLGKCPFDPSNPFQQAKTENEKSEAKSEENSKENHEENSDEKSEKEARNPDYKNSREEDGVVPEGDKKSGDETGEAKPEICNLEKVADTAGAKPKQNFKSPETHVKKVTSKQEEKEKSPEGSEAEALSCADGWTLLNEDGTDKKVAVPAETPAENLSNTKEEVNPSVGNVSNTKSEVCYPKLQENATVSEKILEQEKEVHPQDPKVANALLKMKAMGFTNEGGWLERLLVTKQGNINEALDALYPNTQRH